MTDRDRARLTARTTLEIVRRLPASRERVWEFLTDGELRQRWFCGGETEPRVGGVIAFEFDHRRLSDSPPPPHHSDQETASFTGEVTVWDPPSTLAFLWPEHGGGDTLVTIRLEQVEGGTRLHLNHERLTRPEDRTGAAAGWHAHFDLLEDLLADRPVRDFWRIYTPLEQDYRARFDTEG